MRPYGIAAHARGSGSIARGFAGRVRLLSDEDEFAFGEALALLIVALGVDVEAVAGAVVGGDAGNGAEGVVGVDGGGEADDFALEAGAGGPGGVARGGGGKESRQQREWCWLARLAHGSGRLIRAQGFVVRHELEKGDIGF